VNPLARLTEVRHAHTHFTLTEVAWRCELVEKTESESLRWVPLDELGDYSMGKVNGRLPQSWMRELRFHK